MPIVVDEVVISVEVTGGAGDRAAGAGGAAGGSGGGALSDADRQALVSECVERVLDVLDRREEP